MMILLYYKCPKINLKHGGCDRLPLSDKILIATINSINKDNNKYFQYAATFALNYKEIRRIWGEHQKLKFL